MRDLNSKFDSLLVKIEELKPTVICLTETHLLAKEACEIDGYSEPFRNDRDKMGGGSLIAVRKEIENICTLVEKKREIGESMWMVIDNNKVKIRLGLIYAPQECRTKKEKLKMMYNDIQDQVMRADENNQKTLLLGDFNCKIGKEIKGNRSDVSKGGKLLLKMADRNQLSILNKSELCEGLWTRTDNKTKSVLDYIMVDKDSETALKRMVIDEAREFAPASFDGTESDHNMMLAEFNWIITEKSEQMNRIRKINTEKTYARASQEMEEERISEILEQDLDIQICYNQWKQAVEEIVDRNKIQVKKKNPRKAIKLLVREKKITKKCMRKATPKEREAMKCKVKEIDSKIKEESSSQFRNKIIKIVDKLKSDKGINGANTWELLKRLKRRKENTSSAVKDKNGVLLEERGEIMERYLEHFVDILKPPEANNLEEKVHEEIINQVFDDIVRIASQSREAVTTNKEVERAISELKNKKCKDEWGWKNEILKAGKGEMTQSLVTLFSRMEVEQMTPSQWNEVLINTIPKKGSCLEMDNKRGLFLSEVISKTYEKVIKNRNEKHLKEYISDLQTGGTKGRATVDNKILLSEIFRKNRKLGKKTYVVYGDAVKCFDKLWLKDALVELYKAGCSPLDIQMIYCMNKETEISVLTPFGKTRKVKVGEIVKQGTVLGPTLCCVETDQINSIGEDQTRSLGKEIVGILIFVDDVMSAGFAEDAEKCIRNLREMEKLKKFTYGLKKTLYMVIKTGKDKEVEIDGEVKAGKVKKCTEYEYLGFWVNEDGNCQLQIEKRGKKIKGEIAAIKSLASYYNVGPSYLNVRLYLYENCILPSLLYDLEGWNKLSKKEIKKLESIQLKTLCTLLDMPKTTPYLGLLNELGIWSIEERMKYRKIMLYHNLLNSSDDRLAKRVVMQQIDEDDDDSFYATVKSMLKSLKINIEDVKEMTKAELKKTVKERISECMINNFKKLKMKKLRFVEEPAVFQRKRYLVEMNGKSSVQILKTRLNMIEIYGNYKHDLTLERLCPLCKEEEDTTEHLLSCPAVEQNKISPAQLKNDDNPELWRQINELIAYNMEKREALEPGYRKYRQNKQKNIKRMKSKLTKQNKKDITGDVLLTA